MFPIFVTRTTLSLLGLLELFGPTILLYTIIKTIKIRKIVMKIAILFFGNLDFIEKALLRGIYKHIAIRISG
jgi:hypothetical protein